MRHTSGDLLEFPQVTQLIGRFVETPYGRAALEALAPVSDRAWLEDQRRILSEALEYLRLWEHPLSNVRRPALKLRLAGIPDCRQILAKLRIEGAFLDGKQLLEIATFAQRVSETKRALSLPPELFPFLSRCGSRLMDLAPLSETIQSAILPDGSVSDGASSRLAEIRREIERTRRRIQESLESFLARHRSDGVLQEQFVTIRNDRFVIPVVAGRHHMVHGVIHAASGTGHTLFVEPFETIELNNELVRLREEEAREVERVLAELTNRVREVAGSIAEAVDLIGELDLLLAKARFARAFDATVPRFAPADSPRLVISEARHPLLQDVLQRRGQKPVPISLELDQSRRVLLISGPNAGGKTVTLKTVGLLSLMAQAGLPVTASSAELPVFDQVLADIGDNQSIQESLSTFTAHIRRIREMLELASPHSLILLDELGRATDPEEAGALGIAILERFRASGAFTLASTHLTRLKVYGATTPGVGNAAVGFDENTLQPTYKLQVGLPGKSAGIEVAARLGLPEALIEHARALVGTEHHELERLLRELQQRLERTREMEQDLQRRLEAVGARERQLKEEFKRKLAARVAELEGKLEAALAEFEGRVQEIFQKIQAEQERQRLAELARRRLAQTKRELRERFEAEVSAVAETPPPSRRVEPGAIVRLRGVRQPARVLRMLKDDRLEVEAGLLKLQVSYDDVIEVLPPNTPLPKPLAGVELELAHRPLVREINVIGKRADEACAEVDKFIDAAALAAVDRVRIIHGHGMGVLRRAIAELLASNPHVERFYPAPPEEGGSGVTIAELRS